MSYSTCCGAKTNETDLGICPECLEHCDWEEEYEKEDNNWLWVIKLRNDKATQLGSINEQGR